MSSDLCKLASCDVANSGVCHLKHDPLETCPNYAVEDETIDDADMQPPLPDGNLEPVVIASGEVMHLDELGNFGRERQIRTVVLVGERKAGKTTLLASIYAMFLKGPYAGLTFAGSVTLVGFAKRHYLALLNSGRTDPTTPRTSRDDPPAFFHLALSKECGQLVNLIIADRSGEAYGDARISTELIGDLPELRQADRVCFLLDGARLASKESRGPYARQFKQLIHALHDNGALTNVSAVEVLATKLDHFNRSDDPKEQLKFLDEYEASLVAEFRDRGLTVECYRICALPKRDRSIGFLGLEEALKRWTAAPVRLDIRPLPAPNALRQFDRLDAKRFGDFA